MSLTIEAGDFILFALTLDECARLHIPWGDLFLKVEDRDGLMLWIYAMQQAIEEATKNTKTNKGKEGMKWKR